VFCEGRRQVFGETIRLWRIQVRRLVTLAMNLSTRQSNGGNGNPHRP
jgi:hypothetical protein